MVALGGMAVSYERGNPVGLQDPGAVRVLNRMSEKLQRFFMSVCNKRS